MLCQTVRWPVSLNHFNSVRTSSARYSSTAGAVRTNKIGDRMAIIRPFHALRPPAERAAQVAAVPYDVVNTAEARERAAGNPWSFLHVSRPEIDLPDGTPIYSDEVYAKAVTNFEKLKKEGPLQLEETPSLYLYRLIMGRHEQMGV